MARFNLSKIFYCDSEQEYGVLIDILRTSQVPSGFALSGVYDFLEHALRYDEYVHALCPKVSVKEVDFREGVDALYNEPLAGKLTYQRTLSMHSMIKSVSGEANYGPTGIDYTTVTLFHFPVMSMVREDWSPIEGDQIIHLGRLYGIEEVYVDPAALHGHTGLPTGVSCKTQVMHTGDGRMFDVKAGADKIRRINQKYGQKTVTKHPQQISLSGG